MFVMRKGDAAYGYVNDCPHTRSPLNWQPDVFLDTTKKHIQCSTHGAQFRIEDGFCIWGPCKGELLKPLPVRVESGVVVVA
jgi:nitrite reductase/ring-hydroxylating ferredoxin subunit